MKVKKVQKDDSSPTKTKSQQHPSKPKKIYPQKYIPSWTSEPQFKGWLNPVYGKPYKAQCLVCKTEMIAKRWLLEKHGLTSKHTKAMKDYIEKESISKNPLFNRIQSPAPSEHLETEENSIKKAEIVWTAYTVEHNIPLQYAGDIVETANSIYPDSGIAKAVTLNKNKALYIIKNVIARSHFEEINHIICKNKFSIIMDEMIDSGTTVTSAICVRYYEKRKKSIVNQFWRLLEVNTTNIPSESNVAQYMYELLMKTFEDASVPLENIVGFCSVSNDIMFDKPESIASLVKNRLPMIFTKKCICHTLYMSANDASKKLPESCEEFARNIFHYFKIGNIKTQLEGLLDFLEVDPETLLRPGQTRWLSLQHVVDTIIQKWDWLIAFFSFEPLTNNNVDQIISQLNNPLMKLYFHFLSHILEKFVSLIEIFESDKVNTNVIDQHMTNLYCNLLFAYMDKTKLRRIKLKDVNPENESIFLPTSQIYLGVDVNYAIGTLITDEDQIDLFKIQSREFIIAACLELKSRYDFGDPLFSKISVLTPSAVLQTFSSRAHSIVELVKCILPITSNRSRFQRLEDLWRKLPDVDILPVWADIDIDIFWTMISNFTNELGEREFKELAQFALDTLIIPYSSVVCKDIFSKMKTIKANNKNLTLDEINAILLTSYCVGDTGAKKFIPSTRMLDRMNFENNVRDEMNISSEDFMFEVILIKQ